MSEERDEVIERFAARWAEDLGRAIQAFAGEEPVVAAERARLEDEADIMAKCAWWKQTVENEESFQIWVGSTEPTWTALGGALGNSGDSQATFFEMLSQANQASVAAFSVKFATPLQCLEGSSEEFTSQNDMIVERIRISFRNNELKPIFLVMEPAAFMILSQSGAGKPAAARESATANLPTNSAILERLMDLKLPVSVLLGKATMKIKDVLKVTPGSIIELDRHIGDYVEIMVHGKVVAKGEIVSVKGNYGVRIKEIISRQDRLALHEAA